MRSEALFSAVSAFDDVTSLIETPRIETPRIEAPRTEATNIKEGEDLHPESSGQHSLQERFQSRVKEIVASRT